MKTVQFSVPAMSCQHCVHTIQNELSDLKGVVSVQVDLEPKLVRVNYDTPASEENIKALLKEINYPVKE